MHVSSRHVRALAAASLLVATALPAWAQTTASPGGAGSPGWFVPKPAAPAATAAPHRSPSRAVASEAPAMPATDAGAAPDAAPADNQPLPQYNLPPLAPLPPLPKTAPPPGAVIGVLGVPDVMRASTAYQQVQKIIGVRRDKLAADYQKQQQVWRDQQQQFLNERGKIPNTELATKEEALQRDVARETKVFRARSRVIQEAGQVALAQIERVLVAVIRQVSESRGMNLVLHREQVALNIADFDITDEVTAQLNTLLPSVVIPPDGQEPTPQNTGGLLQAANAPAAAAPPAAPPAAGPRVTPH